MFKFMTTAAAVAVLATAATAQLAPDTRSATLKGAGGISAGKAAFTAAPKGVIIRIEAVGLTPGWHGVHLHEKADCSDAAFKNSGGHVHNQTPVVHGLLNAAANDSGDLPNIYAGSDGTASVELYTNFVSMHGEGSKPTLLDKDGSALVIHAKPDDYSSQPIGGSGDRVACAAIGGGSK